MARFDHHCAWLNQCVGEENYKHFLIFLAVRSTLVPHTPLLEPRRPSPLLIQELHGSWTGQPHSLVLPLTRSVGCLPCGVSVQLHAVTFLWGMRGVWLVLMKEMREKRLLQAKFWSPSTRTEIPSSPLIVAQVQQEVMRTIARPWQR